MKLESLPLITPAAQDTAEAPADAYASETPRRSIGKGYYWEADEGLRLTSFRRQAPSGRPEKSWLNGLRRRALSAADVVEFPGAIAWDVCSAAVAARAEFYGLIIAVADDNGDTRYLWLSGEPAFDAQRRFAGYRGLAFDESHSVRAYNLLQLEHSVSACLAEFPPVDVAISQILRTVCEIKNWTTGRFYSVDREANVLRHVATWTIDDPTLAEFVELSRHLTPQPGQGLMGTAWQTGAPVWVENTATDPRVAFRTVHASALAASALVMPVTFAGDVLGVFNFGSRRIRRPDARLELTLSTIGSLTGAFLERHHSHQELLRARSTVEHRNSTLETIQETSPDAILLVDEAWRIRSINGNFRSMWRITDHDVVTGDDQHVLRRVTEQVRDPETFLARIHWLYEHRDERAHELVHTLDGRVIDRHTAPVTGSSGAYLGRVWFFRDVTEQVRANDALVRINCLLQVIANVQEILQIETDEHEMLARICDILETEGHFEMAWVSAPPAAGDDQSQRIAAGERTSARLAQSRHAAPDDAAAARRALNGDEPVAWCPLSATLSPHASAPSQYIYLSLRAESGARMILGVSVEGTAEIEAREFELLRRLASSIAMGVDLLRNLKERRFAQGVANRLANFDALTDLPNRANLLATLDRRIGEVDPSFAVISIDVPRIDELSSTLGFGASDTVVMSIAARLSEARIEGEFVARIGGSEFAAILTHQSPRTPEAVRGRAGAILAALQKPVSIGISEISIQARIGVAMHPEHGADGATLLARAQTARSSCEGPGADAIAVYGVEHSARAARLFALESALERAVEKRELRLVYQPEVDLRSGEIVTVEALLRWKSEQFGDVPPTDFVPLAERTGAITAIGDWVLREACGQAIAWHAAREDAPRVAVNLSARQLADADISRRIQSIVLEVGCEPSWLGIEITESTLIADSGHAARVLRELKSIGIEIYLDDFGTGFSSLSRLASMPIDVVKIDRSLVPDVSAAPEDVSMTRAIITMAHSLHMRVVAEGVETEGQLAMLSANSCDRFQGYFFSCPLEVSEMSAMLATQRRLDDRYLRRDLRKRTLLLVDDEENILSALRRLLRREGYQILCANGAAAALELLAKNHVDVIVSDQRMPGMTGVELLRRAKEIYPETVRMVLSGYTELQSIIDAVNEGAIYKFLTKPWDDQRLCAHIAEAFRQKELIDENRRLAAEVESANGRLADVNGKLQRALAQHSTESNMAHQRADVMQSMLDVIPAALVGVGSDGVVAFVGGGAREEFPELASALGRPAATVLPAELLAEIQAPTSKHSRAARVWGRMVRATAAPMRGGRATPGQVVALVPFPEADGSEVCE